MSAQPFADEMMFHVKHRQDLEWSFRTSSLPDAEWMAELRAVVMRSDLERLGRFDERRVRERFLEAFVPAFTRVIVCDGQDVGLVALRPDQDCQWVEHFYLHPSVQGRGLGGQVLGEILNESASGAVQRLNVLRGSPARRLYERHGFVVEHEDAVDVFMIRRSADSGRPFAP